MKVFFDTEFTGLHQNTTLISIGAVKEDDSSFYAEFGDFETLQVDRWVQEHIINNLKFHPGDKGKGWRNYSEQLAIKKAEAYGNRDFVRDCFVDWVGSDTIEFWSDCLSYDWVLLCQLFGGALNVPKNWYYIPFDICTLFKFKGVDPDINREGFSGMADYCEKHNALWDAQVIKKCYEILVADKM